MTLTLAYLLDEPATREYVRPAELQLLLIGLEKLVPGWKKTQITNKRYKGLSPEER